MLRENNYNLNVLFVKAEGACRGGGLRTELTNPGVLDATGKKQIDT